MEEDQKFAWTKECQKTFKNLRNRLTETPILEFTISLERMGCSVISQWESHVSSCIYWSSDCLTVKYTCETRPIKQTLRNGWTIQKSQWCPSSLEKNRWHDQISKCLRVSALCELQKILAIYTEMSPMVDSCSLPISDGINEDEHISVRVFKMEVSFRWTTEKRVSIMTGERHRLGLQWIFRKCSGCNKENKSHRPKKGVPRASV